MAKNGITFICPAKDEGSHIAETLTELYDAFSAQDYPFEMLCIDDGSGDGNHEPDVMGADPGTEDYDFQVRAERSGNGAGRVYTVVYLVTDEGGLDLPERQASGVRGSRGAVHGPSRARADSATDPDLGPGSHYHPTGLRFTDSTVVAHHGAHGRYPHCRRIPPTSQPAGTVTLDQFD